MSAIDLDGIFRHRTCEESRLLKGGFAFVDGRFIKEYPIGEGAFTLLIRILPPCDVSYSLHDCDSGDEYTLIHAATDSAYVNQIRVECEDTLISIAHALFDPCHSVAGQAKRMFSYMAEKLSVQPDFLWENTPDCCAFRKANGKWFAVFMRVDLSIFFFGLFIFSNGEIDIIRGIAGIKKIIVAAIAVIIIAPFAAIECKSVGFLFKIFIIEKICAAETAEKPETEKRFGKLLFTVAVNEGKNKAGKGLCQQANCENEFRFS